MLYRTSPAEGAGAPMTMSGKVSADSYHVNGLSHEILESLLL